MNVLDLALVYTEVNTLEKYMIMYNKIHIEIN